MITEPRIDERPEQPYVGIRAKTTMPEFSAVIDAAFPEVFAWLEKRGIALAGAPLIRYHVINMAGQLDVEIGIPVAAPVSGDDRVMPGILPAGRYASVLYTGDYSGLIEANRVLIDWAKENNIRWDTWVTEAGDGFGSRYESYITDPGDEPDAAKWETEVAIRLADGQS